MPVLERSVDLGSIDAGFAVNHLGEMARVDGCLNCRGPHWYDGTTGKITATQVDLRLYENELAHREQPVSA